MEERDRRTWAAIIEGTHQPTWIDVFGDVADAGVLTPDGEVVVAQAARFLDDYFGAPWLPRALGADNRPPGVASLRKFSPLSAFWRQGPVTDLLRWCVCLQAVQTSNVPGAGQMRRDARKDISTQRFMHTLTQSRLAAMGLAGDVDVELEVQRKDMFGDVLWRRGPALAVIEVVTITTGDAWQNQVRASDAAMDRLRTLGTQHTVYFRGDLPQVTVDSDAPWWDDLNDACAQAAISGVEQLVPNPGPDSPGFVVVPGDEPVGNVLSGPLVQVDQGRRFLARLRDKAKQTARSGSAVVWVEDHGLLGPWTPFAALTLPEQVDALAELIDPVLNDHQHIAAVVLSESGSRRRPLPAPQTAATRRGHGMVRPFPWDRVRRTLVVPGASASVPTTGLVLDLVDREPLLMDTCANRFSGYPTMAGLLRDP